MQRIIHYFGLERQYVLKYGWSVESLGELINERDPIKPEIGAEVKLRTIHHRGSAVPARIEQVGAQFELVPEHQRDDPAVPEWGLPVLIVKPSELDVRPGELVHVRFQ